MHPQSYIQMNIYVSAIEVGSLYHKQVNDLKLNQFSAVVRGRHGWRRQTHKH